MRLGWRRNSRSRRCPDAGDVAGRAIDDAAGATAWADRGALERRWDERADEHAARLAQLIREALEALGDCHPYLEARLLGHLLRFSSQLEAAEAQCARQRASELVDQQGFEDVQAQLCLTDATAVLGQNPEEAARLRRQAYEHFTRLGLAREAADALFVRGMGVLQQGHLEEGTTAIPASDDWWMNLEREKGLEPSTLCLGSRCSTSAT